MSLRKIQKRRRQFKSAVNVVRQGTDWTPHFIVGAPRSGTTILGKLMDTHRQCTCLMEPRGLWRMYAPECDIWTEYASARRGDIHLDGNIIGAMAKCRLRNRFRIEQVRANTDCILEKTPENIMRINFLLRCFPSARFVHILRDPTEVAESINKFVDTGKPFPWYGVDDYKWSVIIKHAKQNGFDSQFLANKLTRYERAVVEWTCHVKEGLKQSEFRPNKFLNITYKSLIDRPADIVKSVETHLGLDHDASLANWASKNVYRQTPPTDGFPENCRIHPATESVLCHLKSRLSCPESV